MSVNEQDRHRVRMTPHGEVYRITGIFRSTNHVYANSVLRDSCPCGMEADSSLHVAGRAEPTGSVHEREGKRESPNKCPPFQFQHHGLAGVVLSGVLCHERLGPLFFPGINIGAKEIPVDRTRDIRIFLCCRRELHKKGIPVFCENLPEFVRGRDIRGSR